MYISTPVPEWTTIIGKKKFTVREKYFGQNHFQGPLLIYRKENEQCLTIVPKEIWRDSI